MDHTFEFFENDFVHVNFFPDQVFSLILRIVAVAQSTIISELKLEELVTKLALVPDIVSKVEFFTSAPATTPSVRVTPLVISSLPIFTLVTAHVFVLLNSFRRHFFGVSDWSALLVSLFI